MSKSRVICLWVDVLLVSSILVVATHIALGLQLGG